MKDRELILSVRKKDLRVDTFRAGGPGGQNQNKLETGVRITHLDSGISYESRVHKSQHQNKVEAFRKLAKALHQKIIKDLNCPKERATEVIRTYSEKDDRVIDYASGQRFSYKQIVGKGNISEPLEARRLALRNGEAKG